MSDLLIAALHRVRDKCRELGLKNEVSVIEAAISRVTKTSENTVLRLTPELIQRLEASGKDASVEDVPEWLVTQAERAAELDAWFAEYQRRRAILWPTE